MIAKALLFVLVAVFGGLGSTWYMIERGTALTTSTQGPWVAWTAAGRDDADPYTRAHFARNGILPISTSIALTYEARRDSGGRLLQGGCEYAIEGDEPAAAWWSLAVYDDRGQLIPNAADRYSYNSATLMRGSGTRLVVTLAPSARPGNWLPTGNARRLVIVLSMEEPEVASSGSEAADGPKLPQIRRVACL